MNTNRKKNAAAWKKKKNTAVAAAAVGKKKNAIKKENMLPGKELLNPTWKNCAAEMEEEEEGSHRVPRRRRCRCRDRHSCRRLETETRRCAAGVGGVTAVTAAEMGAC